MKKVLLLIIICFLSIINVSATSGTLRKDSIFSCDEIIYGIHGSDNHYHKAILNENGNYVAEGDAIYDNPCPNNNYGKRIEVTLNECVDGDTVWFNVDKVKTKFRFLAIDTPETVHPNKDVEAYGTSASSYTCNVLKNASKIEIEYDPGSAKLDKYNRNLAWIFVDDKLLQEDLVQIGYAHVAYIYGNYKYTRNLCYQQSIAIKNKRGLWNDETKEEGYCSSIDYSNEKEKTNVITKVTSEESINIEMIITSIISLLIFALVIKKKK